MQDPKEAEAKRQYPLVSGAGVSGLRASGGYIREEFLADLTGDNGRRVYTEMSMNDSTVHAILFAVKMLLRSAEWNMVPASDDPDAIEAAELVEGMLFKDMTTTWPEVIDSACSMFTYGFAVQEVLFKKRNGPNRNKPWLASEFDDGLWGIQSLASRSQLTIKRWIFDEEQHLLGFEQWPFDGPSRTVPITRCLHFRTTAELDNPEGVSLIRGAYRSWQFLKKLQEIEGVGIERDLAGYPVLKVPAEILSAQTPETAAAKTAYETFLRNVRRDTQEGVLLPSDTDENGNPFYTFELTSTGGARQIQVDAAINRYQRDIARSILADFIFLGSEGGGSLALGQTKVQTFTYALSAYMAQITAEVNEKLIPMIWLVNGLDDALRPTVQPEDLAPEDLDKLAAYLTSLANIGYPLGQDKNLENVLRQKAKLPDAPEGEEDDIYTPEEMAAYRDPVTTTDPTRNGEDPEADDEDAEEVGKAGAASFFAGVLGGYDGR